jgi:cytochrome c-type biogenesis protein CcmH/NrfG
MPEQLKPERRMPPRASRDSGKAGAPAARRVAAPKGKGPSANRGQLVFAVLGLLVIVSLISGTVATGFTFGLGAEPTADTAPQAPAGSGLVPTYEARIRDNPTDTGAMVVLANTLQNQGDYPGAITWYEKAVTLKPDDVELRLAFGQALFSFGELFDAEVQYQKALELNAANAKAEYYLAELYQRWTPPRTGEARQHYQRARELEPEGAWGRASRAALDRLNATPVPATATP